jgi:hypothetical protein
VAAAGCAPARRVAAALATGFAGAAVAAASSSWKLSRTHCANTSGSGINSRHEVGEMMMRPS